MLRVKEICKKLGISQAELANKLGVSPSAINQRITGNPTLDKIEETANALGVPIFELFTESTQPPIFGYIECNGQIEKIASIEDLENLLQRLKGDDIDRIGEE